MSIRGSDPWLLWGKPQLLPASRGTGGSRGWPCNWWASWHPQAASFFCLKLSTLPVLVTSSANLVAICDG
eukprot:7797226-Pyramimonas_sp.AAC.1